MTRQDFWVVCLLLSQLWFMCSVLAREERRPLAVAFAFAWLGAMIYAVISA